MEMYNDESGECEGDQVKGGWGVKERGGYINCNDEKDGGELRKSGPWKIMEIIREKRC